MTIIAAFPNAKRFTRRTAICLIAMLCCVTSSKSQNEILTNASDILTLSGTNAASGVAVHITGVVTVADSDWGGRFFMQDASAGIFVENISKQQPVVGDVVDVSGITLAGGYAPCITKPHWEKIGEAALPAAKAVTIEQLMSGAVDSQRIEISGVVRSVQTNGNLLDIKFASGSYRIHAFAPVAPGADLPSLIGARVRLRATAATSYNASLRHLLTVTLYLSTLEDLKVEQSAPAEIFEAPLTPLTAIAQYRYNNPPDSRVHVKGIVTAQRGEDLFLQDETGGLHVRTGMTNFVAPGDVVEAVGFPAVRNFLPVLEDAIFRKVPEPRRELQILPVNTRELVYGLHHADYVTLNGVLIDRLIENVGRTTNTVTTLVLQTTNLFIVAEENMSDPNDFLTSIPLGSVVEVSGVCQLETGDDGRVKSARILLPTPDDVRILRQPSWLTTQRLLTILVIVFAVLLVVASWSVMVSQKNLILKSLVREKETAQKELQEAHDLLEERVKQRSSQLKVEMTARKTSELQFRAVLTERTRLAQELHDTLEQTMTGIALQLDLVASQFQKNPDDSAHHLMLARRLIQQSQSDVRQSVWGLRSRAQEEFNFINAININSHQIVSSAGINIEIGTSGTAQPLSEIVEENLLRISQEAVTNVVKHSGARTVKVELQFEPQKVVLEIRDDGKGFSPENCAGPADGHFGLLGIRERTERLGGDVRISSAPNVGTTIRVEIPIAVKNGDTDI